MRIDVISYDLEESGIEGELERLMEGKGGQTSGCKKSSWKAMY